MTDPTAKPESASDQLCIHGVHVHEYCEKCQPITPGIRTSNLVATLRKESACICGCYSGGCDRPEGCRCSSKCPCQAAPDLCQAALEAVNEIERLTRERDEAEALAQSLQNRWASRELSNPDLVAENERLRAALQRAYVELDDILEDWQLEGRHGQPSYERLLREVHAARDALPAHETSEGSKP